MLSFTSIKFPSEEPSSKIGAVLAEMALVPAGSGDDEAEDLEVSILKSVEENGEEFLEAIEDDAELEAVYSALMDLIYEDEEEPEA